MALATVLVAMPDTATAQASLHVWSEQPDLTLQRVSGTTTALVGTARGAAVVGIDIFSPVCLVPCDVSIPTGTYQFAISRGRGGAVRAGEPITLSGSASFELTYQNREAMRIAGWLTWIGTLLGGGAMMIGAVAHAAVEPINMPLLVAGAVVVVLGEGVGIGLAFLNDDAQIRRGGGRSASRSRVSSGSDPGAVEATAGAPASANDVQAANEAVAGCEGIGGATLRVAIDTHGEVLRAEVTGVADAAVSCAETALRAAHFAAASALRQVHVEIDAAGARLGDRATLINAMASCGGLPPGSDLRLTVVEDGTVTDVVLAGVDATTMNCLTAGLLAARLLPRAHEARLHMAMPSSVSVDDATSVPAPPGGVDAAVRALVETRRASILACTSGAAIAVVAEWTVGGAVTLRLPDTQRDSAEYGCVAAAGTGLTLETPPGQSGSLLHALQ